MNAPVRRVALISMHTSPIAQPGTGDAGGLNVYVAETARRLARRGVEVEIFTRATSYIQAPVAELAPGVMVRQLTAGPFEGLVKEDLPGQLCAFAAGVMREGARAPEGWFDIVHSHYWLSGQVGWLVADRWRVPLVHSMHTMAKVKNGHLAQGDRAEPPGRLIGEEQVVQAADVLVANTDQEKRELIDLYGAQPDRVRTIAPGVDLDVFTPGDRQAARAGLGIAPEDLLLLFVGRIQPLKAPDVLVRAAARLIGRGDAVAGRVRVVILGGESGTGAGQAADLRRMADDLGIADRLRIEEPVARGLLALWFRAADLVVVPSHSESFGLVAIEAAACGTPVVAAEVGGLPAAVGPGGVLVAGHDPRDWAEAIGTLLADPGRRAVLGQQAVRHAAGFSWDRTVETLLEVYRQARAGVKEPV